MVLMKPKQVCQQLNCSLAHIYALIETGKLPHVRIGVGNGGIRIDEDDLCQFVDSRRTVILSRAPSRRRLKHLRT